MANPVNPVVLGSVGTGSSPVVVAVRGTTAYVVNQVSNTLQTFSFASPPRVVAVQADGSLASVALPGGADFVQNGTAPQAASNFNVSGAGTVGGLLTAGSASVTGNTTLAATTVAGTTTINGTGGGTTSIGGGTGATTINGGAASGATNLGTGSAAGAVRIGRTGGTVALGPLAGSGIRLVTADAGGTLGANPPVYGTAATPVFPTAATGSVGTGSGAYSVAVSGTTAYVVNFNSNTLQVFDVATPASPVLLGSVGTGSSPISVAVSGTTVFVVNLNSNTLQVFDAATPASPVLLGSVGTGTNPISVAVSGSTAYVVNINSNTLQAFNVATPASPTLLGSVGTGSFPRGVAVSGTTAYVANSGSNTLQVFNMAAPASPVLLGSVGTGSNPYSVAVSGTTAYVVNRLANTLQAFNVATPASPVLLGSVGTGTNPYSVAVSGTTAYVVNAADNTLQGFDVANPASPALLGSVGTGSNPLGVAVRGTTAYVVNQGSNTLQTFSVFLGPPRAVAVQADGSLASVALPGGTDFVQNGTAPQAGSNFNVSGAGTVGGLLTAGSANVTGDVLSTANIVVDGGNANAGTVANTLRLGASTSGEAIGSKRTAGGNRFGLDLYTASVPRLSIDLNGNVGIGTSSPAAGLHIDRPESASATALGVLLSGGTSGNPSLELRGNGKLPYLDFAETSGVDYTTRLISSGGVLNVQRLTGTGTLLNVQGGLQCVGTVNTSDQRLKEAIRPLAGALAGVLALRGVRYRWNALGQQRGGAAGAEQVGVLAQEVEQIYPELVSTGPDGFKAVNYAQLTAVLIEALKEQQAQLQALHTAHAALQAGRAADHAAAAADHASLLTLQAQLARLLGDTAPATAQARK